MMLCRVTLSRGLTVHPLQEIVKDSLLQGCLPLAQSFVLRHSSTLEYQIRDATTDDVATPTVTTPKTPLLSLQSLEDAIDQETTSGSMVDQDVIVSVVPPTSFTYQAFLSTGIGLVVEALHKEDVELARHLILNMVSHFITVLMYYDETSLIQRLYNPTFSLIRPSYEVQYIHHIKAW